MACGVDVPPGFVVVPAAFREFLAVGVDDDVRRHARSLAAGARLDGDQNDGASPLSVAARIRAAIQAVPMPPAIAQEIQHAYHELCQQVGRQAIPCEVGFGSPDYDPRQAGESGPTLGNLHGPDDVQQQVQACWANLYAASILAERHDGAVGVDDASMAVLVQQMVESESSGTCFTVNPATGDGACLIVESTWGLAQATGPNGTTSDRFVVDKATKAIVTSDVARKLVQTVLLDGAGSATAQAVSPQRADAPSLTPEEVARVAEIACVIEDHFGGPQRIAFAVDWARTQRRLRIVDAEPFEAT